MHDTDIFINSETGMNAAVRAEMFGFMAAMLNRKPDSMLVKRLRAADPEIFSGLIPDSNRSDSVSKGLNGISLFIKEISNFSDEDVEEMLAVDWTRLFRGVSPEYGPPPPYESVYLDQTKSEIDTLRKLRGWYMKHGVDVDPARPDRPDYLGLEMDFLRFLSEQEAEFWINGMNVKAEAYYEHSVSFFSEHLSTWVGRFCNQAACYAETGFYRGLLKIIEGVIDERPVI